VIAILKTGFISKFDINDIKVSSGTTYFAAKAIKKYHGEIEHIFPRLNFFEKWLIILFQKCYKVLLNKNLKLNGTKMYAKVYADKIKAFIRNRKYDVLVTFLGAIETAYLEVDIPIIYLSDATFELMNDYYPNISNLPAWNVKQWEMIEKKAIEKASLCIFSSQWAANSAMTHYGKRQSLTKVVPYGANLLVPPGRKEVIENIHRKKLDKCKLLLVAERDFDRKAAMVEEILCCAKKKGLDISISITGFEKYLRDKDESIKIIPHLDKTIPEDRQRFNDLYMDANIFFLPTKADATPIVCCEAMAFGLPIIVPDTGGLSSLVKNNVNGILLGRDPSPEEYVLATKKLLSDKEHYRQMAVAARNLYEEKHNWDSFGKSVADLIKSRLWEDQEDIA